MAFWQSCFPAKDLEFSVSSYVNVEASLNWRMWSGVLRQNSIIATFQLCQTIINLLQNFLNCFNYFLLQLNWKALIILDKKLPPSGVRVISWSRNCPNCITMCVKPFERSSSVPPSCLCILLDTVRALTFTWKLKTYLVTSLVKIFLNNSRFTFLEKPCAVSEDHAFQALH